MKTPVLIPAHNEQTHIARVLQSLPADRTDPTVIVNGSDDNTYEIAKSFGVNVIALEDPGKLPALQFAFRKLGERALDPVLILDGDTFPRFPNAWHKTMVNQLIELSDGKRPATTAGLVYHTGTSVLYSLLQVARNAYKARTTSYTTPNMKYSGIYGPNMGVFFRNNSLLSEILELPHYWPGEDIAMSNVAIENGGVHKPTSNLGCLVVSPLSLSAVTLRDRIRGGPDEARKRGVANYIKRGPPGSVPYI